MIVNRVKELRTAAGMTQKALADQLGVTVPTVSKWELGQRTPELERVFRMTLIFGVNRYFRRNYRRNIHLLECYHLSYSIIL